MEQKTPRGNSDRLGSIRRGLELVAVVLVIVVALAILYRLTFPQPVPVRAEGKTGPVAPVPPPAPLPAEPLSLANAATMGNPGAKVAIIAYSDFQCPYCGVFARDTWPALQKEYVNTGKVIFAFRHLPLDSIHPKARQIAEAAECARRQGRFWPFHDRMFQKQKTLAAADVGEEAISLGLMLKEFSGCLDGAGRTQVLADSEGGEELGINGTPTFFIGKVEADGRVRVTHRLVGAQSLPAFGRVIGALGSKP